MNPNNTKFEVRTWRGGVALLAGCLTAVVACANVDLRTPSAVTSSEVPLADADAGLPRPAASCEDEDGDGFGAGCLPGPDCDDQDPTITRECRACLRPAVGCPCAEGAPAVACNLDTGTTEAGPDGVCHLGQRVCRGGAWSACEAYSLGHRYVSPALACAGQCNPSCQHFVDCREPSDPLPPAATGVTSGSLPAAVFCPTGTGAGGVQPSCVARPGGPYARSVSTLTWVDACALPGAATYLVSSDEGQQAVSLPFAFSYWGVPYTATTVGANGVMQFATTPPQWVNTTLPAPSLPNSVFAFWDDLYTGPLGVCVGTQGAAPNRNLITQWNNASFYTDRTANLTFQVVLSERDQTVDVLYQTMTGAGSLSSGSSATIGVQEGGGSRFDLVAYNTAGAVASGTKFRWTPTSNDQYCTAGTWQRDFTASCTASGSAQLIPTWGLLNFTSLVPAGSSIRMDVRVANTAAALTSAAWIRLPNAPRATGTTPSSTSYDVGDILHAAMPALVHYPYMQLRAQFDPGPDTNLAPTLGSMEMQFSCLPVEAPATCVPGSACLTAGLCRRGEIRCPGPSTFAPVCTDIGPLPVGTPCGAGQVCNGASVCIPCNEGVACDTGNSCAYGRITCASGAPVCVPSGSRAAGTACGFGSGAYTRDISSFGWINACSVPGADVYLPASPDGATNVTLPFPFRFYGTVETTATISANGFLGFPTATSAWTNTALPAAGMPDAIMPFWDDLQTRSQGICSTTLGRAPDRVYVVQWSNVDLQDRGTPGDLGASLNFEVALEETTQSINVLYGDMVGDSRAMGSGATVGIQRGDGTRYDQVSYNSASAVRANSSIRWIPPITSQCNATGTCVMCTTSETCDNLDNNCNALVDEGIPDINCGVGACRRTVPGCTRGVVPTCTPGTPTTEICNGLDDDCDGMVDDGCIGSLACPADVTMYAGDTRTLTVTPSGMLRSYTWSVVSGPTGGVGGLTWTPAPPTSTTETLLPIIVGVYVIRVTAIDGLNTTRSCQFNLTANSRGLRAELTWNGIGDIDIHMHNSNNTRWFSTDDTYYANLRSSFNAYQDVDNVVSNGPENIRIDAPPAGSTYAIGVHNYANGQGRIATLRLYCGNSGTTPTVIYTSAPLVGTSSGNCTNNTFWRVVRVTVRADGGCDLVPINTFSTSNNACTTL